MTDLEAKNHIAMYSSATVEPILTDVELESLVSGCKYINDFYETVYNLNSAISKAWILKAGKVASGYDFSDGDLDLKRSQIQANCLKMSKEYQKGITSVPMSNRPVRNVFPESYLDD